MNTLKKFLQLKGTKTNIPKSKNTAKPEGIVHCTMNLVVAWIKICSKTLSDQILTLTSITAQFHHT